MEQVLGRIHKLEKDVSEIKKDVSEIKKDVSEINKRLETVEKLSDINYCFKCKTSYHKSIPCCRICEKSICENCAIKSKDEYYCTRLCCRDKV